jgi:hypothetical protein
MAFVLTVVTIGESNAFELPRFKPRERVLSALAHRRMIGIL